MKRRTLHPGFTLLELVLVMVIAATALAIAAPSLRGWRQGTALKNSMEEMLSLTRLARSEAISQGRIYRLEFDQEMRFQLKMQQFPYERQREGLESAVDSAGFVPVPGDFGKVYNLPEGSRLNIEKGAVLNEYQQADARVIDFYPNGRTQAARIIVTDSQEYQVILECRTPAGNFKWVDGTTQ